MRVIFHVDMDSFFASCEMARNPLIQNKPVIIGSNPKGGRGRGVVSTANYKAREYGVKSAMPISKAYNACPKGIYIKPDIKYYKEISNQIMKILSSYANKFQQVSVDEAFLDVTEKTKTITPYELAKIIQSKIEDKTSLTCSIGISHNKSIAKIASDYKKPNGITEVKDFKNFLKEMPIRKISGVGKATEKKLEYYGLETVDDIISTSKRLLEKRFGKSGLRLYAIANGLEDDEVKPRGKSKSISLETTFEKDTNNLDKINKVIERQLVKLTQQLKNKKYVTKTISIKIRYENFSTITRSKTMEIYSNKYLEIKKYVEQLFDENYDKNKKIRLIGIKYSNLVKEEKEESILRFL